VAGESGRRRKRAGLAVPVLVVAAALIGALGFGAAIGSGGFGLFAQKTPQTIYVIDPGLATPTASGAVASPQSGTSDTSAETTAALSPTPPPTPRPTPAPTPRPTATPTPPGTPVHWFTHPPTPTPTPTPYLPNLVMGAINMPDTIRCNVAFTVNAMITNWGPVTSPMVQARIVDVVGGTSWTVGGGSVAALEYGRGRGFTRSVTITHGCSTAAHVLLMEVDHMYAVTEISETDNQQHVAYTLTP